jgi:large subunit ribosomal protein L24
MLRVEPGETAIENVEGVLAGGRVSGQLVLARAADGLGVRARLALVGGDAAALLPGEGKAPVQGRIALQAEVEGSGLSPASLIGSLNGRGTLTLEDAQISGLDPKAFNAAISAVDRGLAVDAARIRDIVATVLDGGRLAVPRLDATVTINAGQASIGHTTVLGQGADLALSGNADLADASIDARLTLAGPVISEGTSSMRPEILVSLKGPYAAPKRSVDVSALSGWLMLRSVERQAKQINAIEAERREIERREVERREAEKRDADRRDAEKQEAERRAAEAKAATSSIPAALPVPQIMEEASPPAAPAPRLARPPRPKPPAAEQPPALLPPLNIGPAPGATKSAPSPRPGNAATAQNPPPPPPRSALETLFGVQR